MPRFAGTVLGKFGAGNFDRIHRIHRIGRMGVERKTQRNKRGRCGGVATEVPKNGRQEAQNSQKETGLMGGEPNSRKGRTTGANSRDTSFPDATRQSWSTAASTIISKRFVITSISTRRGQTCLVPTIACCRIPGAASPGIWRPNRIGRVGSALIDCLAPTESKSTARRDARNSNAGWKRGVKPNQPTQGSGARSHAGGISAATISRGRCSPRWKVWASTTPGD